MDRRLSKSPDNDQDMKPAVIEVSAGTDVIEAIVQFALRRRSGLTIMSCSGTVNTATLHFPLSLTPYFIFHGPFTVLNLTGTFLCPPSPSPPLPPPSTFGITLIGMQGQVFGGAIGGKVVAGGNGVTVMTTLFKNPELYRADGVVVVDEDGDDDDDDDE